jgi:signal transduction histidine kinase/ActR/RegA family two-component response regulator
VLAAVVAVVARLVLDPLGPWFTLVAAYPAIAASAAFGGVGPGWLTTALLAAASLAAPPPAASALPADLARPLLFIAGGGLVAALAGGVGRVRRAADGLRARLADELAARRRVEEELAAVQSDLERRLGERDALLAREQAARAEAQRRQREAEAQSRAKDEFLAVLGHELRNPLGAISHAIRALHETGDRAVKLQSIIARQSRSLGRLLDDLLDVSRIAVGKVSLQLEPVDLREIAERSLAALEQEHRTGRHQVTVTAEPVLVEGDPIRLEQIARNLLDNALKYTPAGGRIDVVVTAETDVAVLRVRDTGEGIPAELVSRIFQPFVQGAPDPAKGGLGLGLSLVKHLVELHGGTVAVDSPGPGQGSEFVVRLPRLTDAPPVADAPPAALAKPVPRRVLLIEDNVDVREGLRMLLESWGHVVTEASDGQRGVELARQGPADVALVDVGLPLLDGYGVARALRSDPRTRHIALVAVTGYGKPADLQRARSAGFDDVLLKPIDPDQLTRILARAGQPAG